MRFVIVLLCFLWSLSVGNGFKECSKSLHDNLSRLYMMNDFQGVIRLAGQQTYFKRKRWERNAIHFLIHSFHFINFF